MKTLDNQIINFKAQRYVAPPIGFGSKTILVIDCYCATPGEDDGNTTCFIHHDCSRGECTHQDGEDE